MSEQSSERMEQRRYRATVENADGEVWGRIEDVPLGNILEFIRGHEGPEKPGMRRKGDPVAYRIEVADG